MLHIVNTQQIMAINVLFHRITPSFLARFDGRCHLCHESTFQDITEMMGVEIFCPETRTYETKYNGKPYWIHANHKSGVGEQGKRKGQKVKYVGKHPCCIISSSIIAEFNGRCRFPRCTENIIVNKSKIMGVVFFSEDTTDFEVKWNDQLYWICSKHKDDLDEEKKEEEVEQKEEQEQMEEGGDE